MRHTLVSWKNARKVERAAEVLRSKGYAVRVAADLAEARRILFELVPEGSSVGLGGSETLAAMDLLSELRSPRYRLFDRYDCADHFEVCRDSLLSDVFLTGANAITMGGEIVNVDCSGSRTAAMMYGPRKVVVVAGANKIVGSIEEALARLREIAPLNCRRLGHRTPCAETGFCVDCDIPERMCNHIGIMLNARKFPGRMNVILVAEEVGF